MAHVTLTISDKSASTGDYSLEFNVKEDRIKEGQITAAHLVGAFIFRQLRSGEMIRLSDSYAIEKGITASSARDEDAATVTLSFIDTDLDGGLYKIDTVVDRGEDATFYTSALLIAEFVLSHVRTSGFLDEMWKYAEAIVAEADSATIANDNRDLSIPSNDEGDIPAAAV